MQSPFNWQYCFPFASTFSRSNTAQGRKKKKAHAHREKEQCVQLFQFKIRKPALVVLRMWGWRRQWHPTPALLPGKPQGRRSLIGCSPWGLYESDTTERLHFHFSLSCIGEGNGNPLQYSCLENPRDGEAWWAAVYGVTQSRTRLK